MILNMEREGAEEAILFLHTGLQTGKTDFHFQSNALKASYTIIRPDLRGHGHSINNDLSNFFEDSAVDLAEMGIDSVHVVGCSLGALVGMAFAKRFPNYVISLTLSGIKPVKPNNWTDLHQADVAQQAQLLHSQDAVAYFDQLHQSDWRLFLEMAKNEDWYPFEWTKDLTGVDVPVLILVGEENEAEVEGALHYRMLKEDVHIGIVPFATHLVHAQQPAIYTELIQTFLKKSEVPA